MASGDQGDDGRAGPGSRRVVRVDIGGERTYSSLTLDELHDWVPRLHQMAATPFLVVRRLDEEGSLVQTYRGAPFRGPDEPVTYALEVIRGSVERHYAAEPELDDPATVADLIWDWVEDRWDRLRELRWNKYDSRGGTFPVRSLDDQPESPAPPSSRTRGDGGGLR